MCVEIDAKVDCSSETVYNPLDPSTAQTVACNADPFSVYCILNEYRVVVGVVFSF